MIGSGDQLVDRVFERRKAPAAAVLDHQHEPAGIADTAHRRRRDRQNERFLDIGELGIDFAEKGKGTQAGPIGERYEGGEDGAGI